MRGEGPLMERSTSPKSVAWGHWGQVPTISRWPTSRHGCRPKLWAGIVARRPSRPRQPGLAQQNQRLECLLPTETNPPVLRRHPTSPATTRKPLGRCPRDVLVLTPFHGVPPASLIANSRRQALVGCFSGLDNHGPRVWICRPVTFRGPAAV